MTVDQKYLKEGSIMVLHSRVYNLNDFSELNIKIIRFSQIGLAVKWSFSEENIKIHIYDVSCGKMDL